VFQSLEYASSRSKDLAHFCTFSETFQQAGPTLQNKTWIAACNFFGIPEVGAKPGEEVASAKAWWVIRFTFLRRRSKTDPSAFVWSLLALSRSPFLIAGKSGGSHAHIQLVLELSEHNSLWRTVLVK
jgi:hypothetical protein